MELVFKELTEKTIGLAIEVHKELGPGLLENTYKQCLAYELKKSGISFQLEVNCPI
jgi:GxxExxY protein